MKPNDVGDLGVEELAKKFSKLTLGSNGGNVRDGVSGGEIETLPTELLFDIFERLDDADRKKLVPMSSRLLAISNGLKLSDCRRAANAIYDYLLPEGKDLAERSGVNRRPHEPPPTHQTIQALASVMNVIPERQPHLVKTVLSIKDDFVRAQSLDVLSYYQDRFEKSHLKPIVDEALKLSATRREGYLLTRPSIPANRVLRQSADFRTPEQSSIITERMKSDRDFRREMVSDPRIGHPLEHVVQKPKKLDLSVNAITKASLPFLGGNDVSPDHYRIQEILRMARTISETTTRLASPSRTETASEHKDGQNTPSRDFSGRAPRGHGGRAD